MALPRIVWRAAEHGRFDTFSLRRPSRPLARDTERLAVALTRFGIPQVEAATTPREDVVGLLMLAAEIEHALMVQYLYAAQSVRGVPGRMISHIAVQEMGHLVTVQNLLLSLTGIGANNLPALLHLGRDLLRRASNLNPLRFVLEPVSQVALAKFIVIERPANILDDPLRVRVDALETQVRATGVDPSPVYALYAAIRWIFQEEDSEPGGAPPEFGFRPGWHLKDSDFADARATEPFCAERLEWGSVPGLIIVPVTDRPSALVAIDDRGRISSRPTRCSAPLISRASTARASTSCIRPRPPRSKPA